MFARCWRPADARLRATLQRAGVRWMEDPTNRDTGYERVRVREALAILQQQGVSGADLARSSRRLGRARAALAHAAAALERDTVTHHGSRFCRHRARAVSAGTGRNSAALPAGGGQGLWRRHGAKPGRRGRPAELDAVGRRKGQNFRRVPHRAQNSRVRCRTRGQPGQ